MDSDFGIPRELSDLQNHRTLYQPLLPPCLQVSISFSFFSVSCNFSYLLLLLCLCVFSVTLFFCSVHLRSKLPCSDKPCTSLKICGSEWDFTLLFSDLLIGLLGYCFFFLSFIRFNAHSDSNIFSMQGTTVRVELGDAATTLDPADAHVISRSFPHTYGQPLAHFLRATAQVPEAHIITQHPAVRFECIFCLRSYWIKRHLVHIAHTFESYSYR